MSFNNKELPLISVIVPVYMVEQYIVRCLESILSQTYRNIEIILIDDGSTDSSGSICDRYKRSDDRITVIHKTNEGLAEARNCGIDLCTGNYISFIDSDDFVSEFYIENLYKTIKSVDGDIASSWFKVFHVNDSLIEAKKVSQNDIVNIDKLEYFERMLYQDMGVETGAWGKLFKRELIKEIRFPKGKMYEDIPFIYRVVDKSSNIGLIPNVDYYYVQRETSIINQKFVPQKMDAIYYTQEFRKYIYDKYPQISNAADCRLFSQACSVLFKGGKNEYTEYQKELWDIIKQLRKTILKDPKARKKAKYAALISYFGLGITRKIYSLSQ